MDTINLNIDPSKSILGLSGGIDSTLGVFLALKQYNPADIHVLHYSRTLKGETENKLDYRDKIIEELHIHPNNLLTDFRYSYRDMGHDFIPMIAEKMNSVSKYTLVRFETEQPSPTTEREIATHLESLFRSFPQEKHHEIRLQNPLKDLNLDRGEIIELYFKHNIQHLLPYTRSCSIQADNFHLKVTSETYHSFKFTREDLLNNVHCGLCFKCMKRKYGFRSVGRDDPTTYLHKGGVI